MANPKPVDEIRIGRCVAEEANVLSVRFSPFREVTPSIGAASRGTL